MRIATYTRISTDEKQQPYSLEAQADRLAAYAHSQEDWEIVRRFSDQKSGATLDHPELERALLEAEAGRFDLLLVYRVDRLARSVRGLAHILERLDHASVLFRSATEPFDTSSSAGRMMVQMLGVFAEFERATIVERVIAGMERKAARGEWAAGKVPYGYRRDEEGRFLVPDHTEAPVVELIFERYARHLEGSATLAQWLTERGYRTRQGKSFNPKIVLGILRNRVYLGEVFFRGIYHQSPHQPLIDPELFDRAGAILKRRGEDYSLRRSNTSDYLLTGLVRCERCGKRYLGAAANGRGGHYAYYVCFSRQRYGRATCDADRLPARKLEDAVLAHLTAALADQQLLRATLDQAHADLDAQRPEREAERDRVDAQIKQAQETLDRYFRAFEKRTMPEQACAERIDELSRQITGLRARRDELDDDPKREPFSDEDLEEFRAEVSDIIRDGDPPTRKALLQALVAEVRVESRAAIRPTFAIPAVRPPAPSVPLRGFEPRFPP